MVRAFFERREALILFVAARTRDMATAEDVVQDLYLKIAGLDPTAEVRAPEALLYRMAANLLVDHARSVQRSSRRSAEWRLETRTVMDGQDVAHDPPADEVVIGKERVRLLADAVASLPPQMGRAFRLHKLDGMTQAQTAQVMGVSVKMVEAHIAAAIKHLAQRLRS
ncbi:RNA polymerase sigma factor [Phenylobacterium sp. J426]|uniref:RNA polymerase sigma factor n=1 Tax=Phenylobacterium sp. J426 TaxID=2898439 RepID=UPI002151A596|nr:sigma-70 family RNA polymerase sigma factor [Phenylobacterium sp. J426]